MDTDIPMSKFQSLLHAIAKLYASVVANVVHERATAYRADISAANDDIGAALHAYILDRKKNASATASPPPSGMTDPVLPATLQPGLTSAVIENANTGNTSNPLSDYFQKNKAYPALATPLGEKLKTSAWAHTHSAIRFAHQGDYASAKLYAELANNAVHELGHYMPEDDFRAFKRAVIAELLNKA